LRNIISSVLLICILSGCSTLFGDKLKLSRTSFGNLKGWQDDNHRDALLAFKKSCEKYQKMPADKKLHTTNLGGTYANWQEVCAKADEYDNPKEFFESNFTPYIVRNWWKSSGLFTGYYESSLKGSLRKAYPYIYPVYKTPKDLVAKQKYFSRAEIYAGALAGKGLELLWVDDPVELFFMQVQGSGRVKLEDGSEVRLGYASQNGYKYYPIGRYMIEKKYLEKSKTSKATIESWLKAHPDRIQEILEQDQSYVFFREIRQEGPIGAQGVALTPKRSLAVDKKFIPYGAPIWMEAKLNGGENKNAWQDFHKLMIAQDTGGAIKGPVRGDIFFGYGEDAEKMAGYQNNTGRYFILLPNNVGINGL